MVPRLPPLPYRNVDRFLQDHGFSVARQSGSHVTCLHPDGRRTVVPRHGRDIPPRLLAKILREAGIDPGEARR